MVPGAIPRCLLGALLAASEPRQEISLSGTWQHQRVAELGDPPAGGNWRPFVVPGYLYGVEILITELDVLHLGPESDVASRDRNVADMYGRFLSVALDEPATVAVVTWGLCDKYTWLTPNRGKNFGRADGQPSRPVPFDEALTPKPAYDAILQTFQNAPPRGGS